MNHQKSYLLLSLLLVITSVTGHERHSLHITELNWQADNISRVVANSIDIQSGMPIITWSELGRVESIDGKSCLVGPYFMFDVDDEFAFNIDETITIEVLFDREQSDGFIIAYDHAVHTPVSRVVTFKGDKSERWQREHITLERAGFTNRRLAATDFSIAALGAVIPYSPDKDHEIAICDLTVKRPAANRTEPIKMGKLKLEVRAEDAHGFLSARVGVYDSKGRLPVPSDDAILIRQFTEEVRQIPVKRNFEYWFDKGRYAFYVDGKYEADLAADNYEIVLVKGPEYRVARQQFDITAGEETTLKVEMKRWIDLPELGWYSGDDHIHIGRTKDRNKRILVQTSAEDLHAANILQMGNLTQHYFPQYAFGRAGDFIIGSHALISGQESPRTSHRGHTISLNGKEYFQPKNYYHYKETADAIRRGGGLFGYAHVMVDALSASLGLALDVPLGLVDFVEVLQHDILGTEVYYDFLNMGYRLTATAGSDYPYINLPGSERTYVYVDGPFSPEAWFEGLRKGRTFVSNAPVLEFTVAGQAIGSEVRIKRGESVKISGAVSINPDFDRPSRLELVMHGEIIASNKAVANGERLSLELDFQPKESCWLALRAYGEKGALVHSSPIYVLLDDSKSFYKRSAIKELASKYQSKIHKLLNSRPLPVAETERWDTATEVNAAWLKQLPLLRQQASDALAEYQSLINKANVSKL